MVTLLLELGAIIDAEDRDLCTALVSAAKQGHYKIAAQLIEKGAHVNSVTRKKKTALIEAAYNGHHETVALLIEKNGDLNLKDDRGFTAMILAAANGHESIVALLLEKGANCNETDNKGKTALMWAAKEGHKNLIVLLLEKGAAINSKDRNGCTPLTSLIRGRINKEVLLLLLEKGADINIKENDGSTALMLATKRGNGYIAEILLDRGASINAENASSETALDYAAEYGLLELVKLFVSKGAKVTRNAFIKAAGKGHTKIVSFLSAPFLAIEMAFIEAAQNGHKEIVKLLINQVMYIDWSDMDGNTALIKAVSKGHKEVIVVLLEKKASVNEANNNGKTALRIAKDNPEIHRLLELCNNNRELQIYLTDPLAYARNKSIMSKKLTTFMVAAIFHHRDVIAFYKDASEEYLITKDDNGYTALDYAMHYNLDSAATLVHCFGSKIVRDAQKLLDEAIEKGSTPLVNAVLTVGAKPTLELALKAQRLGFLKIMHRLLFITLVNLFESEQKKYPQIYELSGLFK